MQNGQHFHTGFKRNPRERAARVRLGSLEFKKNGVSRFDMRDPYHLAVALTWPQFLATLLVTYLLVNVAFATGLSLRVGNGPAHVLMDAEAKLSILLSLATAEGKLFRCAQELRLERAYLPVVPLTWTLMHVMDERSPLHGYDAAQVVAALAQVFVTLEARDPMFATSVHEIRNYPPKDIRFGMRYVDAITTEEDGMPVADLTQIGEMEPAVLPLS